MKDFELNPEDLQRLREEAETREREEDSKRAMAAETAAMMIVGAPLFVGFSIWRYITL